MLDARGFEFDDMEVGGACMPTDTSLSVSLPLKSLVLKLSRANERLHCSPEPPTTVSYPNRLVHGLGSSALQRPENFHSSSKFVC